MLIVERQRRLAQILRQQGAGQLETMARHLGVSASTVRRDLEALERQGLVSRTHGGAIYRGSDQGQEPEPGSPSEVLAELMNERIEQKLAIG